MVIIRDEEVVSAQHNRTMLSMIYAFYWTNVRTFIA